MSISVSRIPIELLTTCSQVALLVPIGFQLTSEANNQHETTNIKFPILVEEWLDVFLNQSCFSVLEQLIDCLKNVFLPYS